MSVENHEEPIEHTTLNEHLNSPDEQFSIEEERLRHWARFDKKSLEHAQRSVVRKIFDWNKKYSGMDFAHTEALRDDADLEKKKHAEYEMWEKKLEVVIERLKFKRDNPDSPEAKEIRPLLLIMGGGIRGAYAAGQALVGLPAIGMDEGVFDTVVGISAGACVGAYLVGNAERKAQGAKVFYDQCCAGEFINFGRMHQVMNIDVIKNIMDMESVDSLNQEGVVGARTQFHVGVVNQESGESEMINAKTASTGLTSSIAASMAMPLVYGKAVEVNGKKYIDGAFDPLPLRKIIEKFNPTDILILPNLPFDNLDAFQLSKGEWLFAGLAEKIKATGSIEAIKKFLLITEELRKDLEEARDEQDVNIGVVWPPNSRLSPISQNPDDVRETVAQSALDLIKRFGGKQKFVKELGLPKRTVLPE